MGLGDTGIKYEVASRNEKERYEKALHAMQTGVKMLLAVEGKQEDKGQFSDKHLAVGWGNTMVESIAIGNLLVGKSVITDDERPALDRANMNNIMVRSAAIVELCVQKGIFTEQEFVTMLANCMETEARSYEKLLSSRFNKTITLL